MNLKKAAFVFMGEDPPYYGIVFKDTAPDELRATHTALAVIGVALTDPVTYHDNDAVICVRVRQEGAESTIARLKELVQPALPITVVTLHVTVQRCGTDTHNECETLCDFLPGFEPPDMHNFRMLYNVQMPKVPVTQLVSADQSKKLAGGHACVIAFKNALQGMGVFVQSVDYHADYCCL
ncbi:MAG TPA: hypothetical protein VLG40_01465 [Candidatus Saccharimonas sp.]|nr:hypothetical protein [Candidatus Saccharimonas sp.]